MDYWRELYGLIRRWGRGPRLVLPMYEYAIVGGIWSWLVYFCWCPFGEPSRKKRENGSLPRKTSRLPVRGLGVLQVGQPDHRQRLHRVFACPSCTASARIFYNYVRGAITSLI